MELDTIKNEFINRGDIYNRLSYVAEEALKNKLKSENIKTAYVISRVKEVDNFLEKVNRKKYCNPLKQMNDIIGVRIVCLYTEDIKKIGRLIESEFNVIDKDNKIEKFGSDKMGYYDLSFVAQMQANYIDSIYKELNQYKFEIQVRSIMSDAGAIISHDLHYKKEPPLPDILERELNLVFSTLELTQYHCDTLRERRKDYVKELEQKAQNVDQTDFLNQPIVDDTLRVYTNKRFPGLPIKENIHALILRDLDPSKYKTLKEIDDAVKYSKEFVDFYKTQSDSFKSGSDYITKSLGYYDEKFLNQHPFAQKTKDAIKKFKDEKDRL